ncbi:hypothetical protein HPB50_023231 [Hyalomma asiaticum]|uniref:Uncharacterized protein n=1 Tax=Hyalomma asiaticum TaxID=266040 RepID=A0ACB7SQE8_HYAAI|nr:hypothetical protein HPB50_023231 [Hyalomma asiaticum]
MVSRRKYYAELGGAVILDQPKKPMLLPGAVPCIFPELSPHLHPAKKTRAGRKVLQTADEISAKRVKVDSVHQDSVATGNESNSLQTNTNFKVSFIAQEGFTSERSSILRMNSPPHPSYNSTTSADENVPMQKTEAGASAPTASWLQQLSSEHQIPMPNPAWNHHYINVDGVECLSFVYMVKASASSATFAFKILELMPSREGYTATKWVLGREQLYIE